MFQGVAERSSATQKSKQKVVKLLKRGVYKPTHKIFEFTKQHFNSGLAHAVVRGAHGRRGQLHRGEVGGVRPGLCRLDTAGYCGEQNSVVQGRVR